MGIESGSFLIKTPGGRTYHTVISITDNIKVVESNNKNANVKLPEESHTPSNIYVVINKPATNAKGRNAPNKAFPLTPEMKKLLEIVKKKVPYAK